MIFTRVVSDELFERAGARIPRLAWHRARALPALGMPVERQRRRLWTALSVALHLAVVWLLLRPEAVTNMNPELQMFDVGGGGAGPAGGGGGGTRGTGGVKYVQVAPPAQTAVTPKVEPILPPVQPVIEPPKPAVVEPIVPPLELPKVASDPKLEVKAESPIVGVGGGTGTDGTRGNGPGTGGGVGSGVGTGRGSGVGPGTGGGPGDFYPPALIEMPLMPLPVPGKLKGTKVVAIFNLDEKGKIIDFEFTPTKDGDYNRKLRDLFRGFKFRPATTLDGVPMRAKYPFEYGF